MQDSCKVQQRLIGRGRSDDRQAEGACVGLDDRDCQLRQAGVPGDRIQRQRRFVEAADRFRRRRQRQRCAKRGRDDEAGSRRNHRPYALGDCLPEGSIARHGRGADRSRVGKARSNGGAKRRSVGGDPWPQALPYLGALKHPIAFKPFSLGAIEDRDLVDGAPCARPRPQQRCGVGICECEGVADLQQPSYRRSVAGTQQQGAADKG